MVLGTLATHGPQHGHQIRLTAEVTNVGEWGGVSVGALYRELKLMAIEGLVTEVRTEQVGRRPARTVYAITDQGRMGLASLRERAIKDMHPPPDPIGVALAFAGAEDDMEELAGWLSIRRDFLEVVLRELTSERERLIGKGHIGPLQAATMRRGELTIRAELLWHDELDLTLAEMRPARSLPEAGADRPDQKQLNGDGGAAARPPAPADDEDDDN
jgi:DNA-binding PadR family transcriptional regulator